MTPSLREIERDKYRRVWRIPSYGRFSPGERMVPHFLDIVKPGPDDVIIDASALALTGATFVEWMPALAATASFIWFCMGAVGWTVNKIKTWRTK